MSDNDKPVPAKLSLDEIEATRQRLGDHIIETPVYRWQGPEISALVGQDTQVMLKLELLQYAGSFKVRGALNNIMQLSGAQRKRGVTAVSSGNHAVATSYAAKTLSTNAKVVMMRGASTFRMALCKSHGAELVIADNVHQAFERVAEFERDEGRYFVHPFEGRTTALGSATLGMELCQQVRDLDAVIISIGGGGLCGGMSSAIKLLSPSTKIYGVEPDGADSMHRSFAAGRAMPIEQGATIADSLNAPYAAPFTFSLCQQNVDTLIKVSDADIRRTMRLMFREMKLAVEPAAAAAAAALCGPLAEPLRGQKVGVLVCGTNTDIETLAAHLRED
ncbi:threonine/serine dehydratase [Sphingopyxis sp.]|uniref:threonine/serine dehydratase n=1 Tax=Sphingopyxis sp. TaxID=1908224 RepID=UPI001D3A5028|nr:threonine/serine dehydratase [Sphingopyxis sp.]MBW8296052.1 threonine/serine dehydratase [Sphingopyxis sp.]